MAAVSVVALLIGVSLGGGLVASAAAAPPDADPPAPPLNETSSSNVSSTLPPSDDAITPASNESVPVVVLAHPGEKTTAAQALADNGTVHHRYDTRIQGTAPQTQLSALGNHSAINVITTPEEPTQPTHSGLTEPNADRIGEGIATMNAEAVHRNGTTGTNATVAVIDTSFDADHDPIADNVVETRDFTQRDDDPVDTRHGDATAEVVANVAPDTNLVLVSISTVTEFATAAEWINDHDDIDVAVASLSFRGVPLDGTATPSQAITDGAHEDVTWVVSAGNDGFETHWSGTRDAPDRGEYIEFADGDRCNWIQTENAAIFEVQWDDWGNFEQRYGIAVYEYDSSADEFTEVNVANNDQTFGHAPFERTYAPGGDEPYCVTVFADEASGENRFDLVASFGGDSGLEYSSPAESITPPALQSDVLTVGAIHWWSAGLPRYSSHGPTPDGRLKPDVVAPTTVSTAAYTHPYGGTSAAAPHAAGAAALVADTAPDTSAAERSDALTETAQPTAAIDTPDAEFRFDDPAHESRGTFTEAALANTQIGHGAVAADRAVDVVADDPAPVSMDINTTTFGTVLTEPTDTAAIAVTITGGNGSDASIEDVVTTLTVESPTNETVYNGSIVVGDVSTEATVTFGDDDRTERVGPLTQEGTYTATLTAVASNADTTERTETINISDSSGVEPPAEWIETGLTDAQFDAVDQADNGTLSRGDVRNAIEGFIREDAVDGVSFTRDEIRDVVSVFIRT